MIWISFLDPRWITIFLGELHLYVVGKQIVSPMQEPERFAKPRKACIWHFIPKGNRGDPESNQVECPIKWSGKLDLAVIETEADLCAMTPLQTRDDEQIKLYAQ